MDPESVIKSTEGVLLRVYAQTQYQQEVTAEAEQEYQNIKQKIPALVESAEGRKLLQKFRMLSQAVFNEETIHDTVKVIWRMVKVMLVPSPDKVLILFLGLGIVLCGLKSRHQAKADTWMVKAEDYLGKKLTSGGRGPDSLGEGSVEDRFKRFFATPYLHDFD